MILTVNIPKRKQEVTNGEVIKAIFPNELLTSITSTLWWGDNMSFNKDWWNASYKKEVEE